MPPIYLTPSAIGNLSLFIFLTFAIGYLFILLRQNRQRDEKPVAMWLLTGAFAGIAAFILFSFLEDVLYPDWGELALPLQTLFLTAGMAALLQFYYRFPVYLPVQKREAKIALWFSLLYPLGELAYAVYRYNMLFQGYVRYRDKGWVLVFLLIWMVIVPLRKIALVDARPVSYWRKLWQPPDHTTRLTRDFALTSLMPLSILGISLLRDFKYLDVSTGAALISVGILLNLLVFTLFYLQALPEQTTFLVKLTAVILAAILGVISMVGYLLTPKFIETYRNPNSANLVGKTIRFTPNDQGGYTADWVPYQVEPIGTESFTKVHNQTDIGFPFPF